MIRAVQLSLAAAVLLAPAACASPAPQQDNAPPGGQQVTQPVVPLACVPSANMPVAGRASPYDSVNITIGTRTARICYGRPSMNNRQIFGGLVPYDSLWRTGANEPTIIQLPFAAEIAGLTVPAGSYSLYTLPQQSGEWTLIVNRSTSQWGHPSSYTEAVRAQELGRTPIRAEPMDRTVEQFTIRSQAAGADRADIVLEWERTRVRIPIRATSPDS
jgi:hypothetical protein